MAEKAAPKHGWEETPYNYNPFEGIGRDSVSGLNLMHLHLKNHVVNNYSARGAFRILFDPRATKTEVVYRDNHPLPKGTRLWKQGQWLLVWYGIFKVSSYLCYRALWNPEDNYAAARASPAVQKAVHRAEIQRYINFFEEADKRWEAKQKALKEGTTYVDKGPRAPYTWPKAFFPLYISSGPVKAKPKFTWEDAMKADHH